MGSSHSLIDLLYGFHIVGLLLVVRNSQEIVKVRLSVGSPILFTQFRNNANHIVF